MPALHRTCHRVQPPHLPLRYLAELGYRFNRRFALAVMLPRLGQWMHIRHLWVMATQAAQTLSDVMHNAESDETRRRAAIDVLEITGPAGDPTNYACGTGPTSADAIEQVQTLDEHRATWLQGLSGR